MKREQSIIILRPEGQVALKILRTLSVSSSPAAKTLKCSEENLLCWGQLQERPSWIGTAKPRLKTNNNKRIAWPKTQGRDIWLVDICTLFWWANIKYFGSTYHVHSEAVNVSRCFLHCDGGGYLTWMTDSAANPLHLSPEQNIHVPSQFVFSINT